MIGHLSPSSSKDPFVWLVRCGVVSLAALILAGNGVLYFTGGLLP
jgi:hypothetical protein